MHTRRGVPSGFCFLVGLILLPSSLLAAGTGDERQNLEGQQAPESPREEEAFARRTDAEIANDVQTRLRNHSGIEEEDITVRVDSRIVTLSGTVTKFSDVGLAGTIAEHVFGAVDVHNTLEVQPMRNTLQGERLAERIREFIEGDSVLSDYEIEIDVNGRSVILEGIVDSAWARRHAAAEIGDIAGITDLRNELAIVPTGEVTDEQIAQDLLAALDTETSTDAENVTILVIDGKVTLEGRVASMEVKSDVEEIAGRIAGVRVVVNKLSVSHDPSE